MKMKEILCRHDIGMILDEKCVNVMQTSKNGKSPSTDGLPIEL
jgi:hypothetical protein